VGDRENQGEETPLEEINPIPEAPVDRVEINSRRRSNGSWVAALILIFLGVVFLLKELDIPLLENWWALFFMIPAIASFGSAWNQFHHHHQVTSSVLGSLIAGLIMVFLTVIFLFSLHWSYMWPIFLIITGLMIFINSFLK